MIKKIISGGQTGADRAALDVAIVLGIPHGGWIPKGRITEEGPLPEKYPLQEMPTTSYPKRTEQNVIDSDGTLIISHGSLTGGSAYTRKMAMKHGKPSFHTDVNKLPTFQAAMVIEEWISKNKIETLNVAGPRSSKDPQIYGLVTVILELVYNLEIGKNNKPEPSFDVLKTDKRESLYLPRTVDEAVNFLISKLSLKDKSALAKMSEDDLSNLHFSFGLYIRNRLLYPRNEKLLESCRREAMDKYLHWDQASTVIIKRLWEKLRESYKLRVVKS
jgi:hypothetical protein